MAEEHTALSGFQFDVSQILTDLQPSRRSSASFLGYTKLESPGTWAVALLELGLGASAPIPHSNSTVGQREEAGLGALPCPLRPRSDRCRVNPVGPAARCNVHVLSN